MVSAIASATVSMGIGAALSRSVSDRFLALVAGDGSPRPRRSRQALGDGAHTAPLLSSGGAVLLPAAGSAGPFFATFTHSQP